MDKLPSHDVIRVHLATLGLTGPLLDPLQVNWIHSKGLQLSDLNWIHLVLLDLNRPDLTGTALI